MQMKAIAKWTALILGSLLMTAILFNLVVLLINGPWHVGLTKNISVEEQKQLPVASVETFTGDHADVERSTTFPPTEKQVAPSDPRGPQAAADTQDDDFDRKARELAKAFRTANSETQARLRQELDALNERHFEYRQQRRQADIDRLTSRIDSLRLLQLRRSQNKSEVLKRRLEELLDPNSDLDWDGTEKDESFPSGAETTGRMGVERQALNANRGLDTSDLPLDLNQSTSNEPSVISDDTDPSHETLDDAFSNRVTNLNRELAESARLIGSLKAKIGTAKRSNSGTAPSDISAYEGNLANEQQQYDKKLKQLKELEKRAALPRYEGRTLEEWLGVLKTERSPEKLKLALPAIVGLSQDADPRTVVRAVLGMSQTLPSLDSGGVALPFYTHTLLTSVPQDLLLEELLAALSEIPPRKPSGGLKFLITMYFESLDDALKLETEYSNGYSFTNPVESKNAVKEVAVKLIHALAHIAQQDPASDNWAILNAYYILEVCQKRLSAESPLIPVVERVFLGSDSNHMRQVAGVMLGESQLKLNEVTDFFRQELKREIGGNFQLFQFTCERIKALSRTEPQVVQMIADALKELMATTSFVSNDRLEFANILLSALREIGEPATAVVPLLQSLHDSETADRVFAGNNPQLRVVRQERELIFRDHIADAIKQIEEARPKPKRELLSNVEPSITLRPKPSLDEPDPAVPAESGQTAEMTFDGIPYSQWLKLLETERKPEKLAAAMLACGRLLQPGDERRVTRAIFLGALAFENGEREEQATVWFASHQALKLIPQAVVLEELFNALRGDQTGRNGNLFPYQYFLSAVGDESSSLMRYLKTNPDGVLKEILNLIEREVTQADSLLAAASTIIHFSRRPLTDFERLHARLLEWLEVGPPEPLTPAALDSSHYWMVAMGNLVRMAPDTPEMATKLLKYENRTDDVFGLLGMLRRHAEPVVPQLVELFLQEWKRLEASNAAGPSTARATGSARMSPDESSRRFWRRIQIVRTLGAIGAGKDGYTLLRQLSLTAPRINSGTNDQDKEFVMAVERSIRSFAPEDRTETPRDLLSDTSRLDDSFN